MHSTSESAQTEQLLDRAQHGDEAAREELLMLHRSYLRQLIELRMEPALKRRLDASDVVQETQLEALRRLEDYLERRPMSFRLWLRQTAIEQLGMQYRKHLQAQKRSLRREVPLSDVSSAAMCRFLAQERPSAILERRELAGKVREALGQLSEGDRELLLMRHAEELNNAEVAELLAIRPAAALKRHGRALRRLDQRLTDLGVWSSD